MNVLVTIPTYNEVESLPRIVARVRAATPEVHILVVDDNSPDGTGEVADRLAQTDAAVHVMHRAGKEGLGRAYVAAFGWALEHGYSHVVEMDADGSHRPEQLPALLDRAGGADSPALVIGSRYVRGGELEGWPKYREVLSRGGNLYIKVCLGLPARDVTAGYRVYSADILRQMDLGSVESAGYFFQTDMTDRVHALGGMIAEVPINFAEREAGESKLSGNIFVESFVRATRMGAKRRGSQLKAWIGELRKPTRRH